MCPATTVAAGSTSPIPGLAAGPRHPIDHPLQSATAGSRRVVGRSALGRPIESSVSAGERPLRTRMRAADEPDCQPRRGRSPVRPRPCWVVRTDRQGLPVPGPSGREHAAGADQQDHQRQGPPGCRAVCGLRGRRRCRISRRGRSAGRRSPREATTDWSRALAWLPSPTTLITARAEQEVPAVATTVVVPASAGSGTRLIVKAPAPSL